MCEKSWTQLREELKMLPRQMCVTPVAEVLEYVDEILKLQEQLQSAQQEIERLRQERDKLIEGLRYLMKELGKLSVKPENGTAIHAYKKMRNILHEIGVTVE